MWASRRFQLSTPPRNGAVVPLGVGDESRVLLRVEGAVLVDPPVLPRGLGSPVPQLDQLLDRLLLARLGAGDPRLVCIDLRIPPELVEARVALARPLGRLGVDAVQVGDDRLHRGVEAVEVEPVEAGPGRSWRERVVPLAQPAHELGDVVVPPHPGREASEVAQRLLGALVFVRRAHEAIGAVGIRPVGFHRDRAEARLRDQPFRDLGSGAVELVGAM
jgi:hypothetical protein